MRNAFVRAITRMAREDDRVIILSADTGIIAFDAFRQEFPDRFVNVGIAEQNMVGMAAGMALEGYFPYCFAISPFASFRCLEQIRVDGCYQNLPVRSVGVGGGLIFGPHGPTHQAIEDLGVLRPIPNLTLIAPCDPHETEEATVATLKLPGTAYLRLGRNNDPRIFDDSKSFPPFEIGKMRILQQGEDLVIISQGVAVFESFGASQDLASMGISTTMVDCHTLKPFDQEGFLKAVNSCRGILVVEEHTRIGGLGSACAEALVSSGIQKPLRFIGIPDCFPDAYGKHAELTRTFGLHRGNIIEGGKKLMSKSGREK